MALRLRLGYLYSLRRDDLPGHHDPPDALAELDTFDTHEVIMAILAEAGWPVVEHFDTLSAPLHRFEALRQVDFVVNFALGWRGRSREGQAAAILESLGIPYSGADATTLCLCLDKTLAKRVLRDHGLPTPPFQVFVTGEEPVAAELGWPRFVKPAWEGSSKGLDGGAVVHDESELRHRVRWVLATYRQPALVEAYLPGDNFTVGVVGDPPQVLPIAWEFPFAQLHRPGGVDESRQTRICEHELAPSLRHELRHLALAAFTALGCRDLARVDFCLDESGRPFVLEVNPLPTVRQGYYFEKAYVAWGKDYRNFILDVVGAGLRRAGLIPAAG